MFLYAAKFEILEHSCWEINQIETPWCDPRTWFMLEWSRSPAEHCSDKSQLSPLIRYPNPSTPAIRFDISSTSLSDSSVLIPDGNWRNREESSFSPVWVSSNGWTTLITIFESRRFPVPTPEIRIPSPTGRRTTLEFRFTLKEWIAPIAVLRFY